MISLTQICDDECIAQKYDKVIFMDRRVQYCLWYILILPPVNQANRILCLDKTEAELANFNHASLGSPA